MYTDEDLDEAIAAGVLTPADVAAFRAHATERRAYATECRAYAVERGPQAAASGVSAELREAPLVDEEQFRLITGFNDIFVVIAIALVLWAIGWMGTGWNIAPGFGAAAVGAAAWALAEYFTRVRHMALPSIVLLLVFVGAVFVAALGVLRAPAEPIVPTDSTIKLAVAAAIASAAAWLHWRRFHVPITVAAGTTALAAVIFFPLVAWLPDHPAVFHGTLFGLGLAVFAFAMRWDLYDPARETQRSDVAFWLHLVAAPMLVQPVFMFVGLLGGVAELLQGLAVIAVYLAVAVVALAIDRRALLVSALAFLLSALSGLFEVFGTVEPNIALAALVVGASLLMLSAFWDTARRRVLEKLPDQWRARLPLAAGHNS